MTLAARQLDCGVVRVAALQVRDGECVALTGPSGSGKTRIMRALADLDPATGEITLDGRSHLEWGGPQWRARVMYVPAESAWWDDRVGAHFPDDVTTADLWPLGFAADVLDWPVARLSSGERQRLALLRAVLRTPRVLLLDEPTANLDSANVDRVERWLAARPGNDGAMLWVSHDQNQLRRVCARGYGIHAGELREIVPWP